MKKEKSPFLVICCILFLSLFIALPPIFRMMIPSKDIVVEKTPQDKIEFLKCNKYFKSELYKVSSSVKYKNELIDSNTITYEKVEKIPEGVEEDSSITVKEEFQMFQSLNNIDITENDDTMIIRVDQNLMDQNLEVEELLNYYQSLENQQAFYENRGYTCNRLNG